MGEVKSRWKRVKLGQAVINSSAATKDHEADGFTRYIIGKHIPEDGGHINSWNPVGDAEFGSRIRTMVRKGDVICTTRGPKLKVAVADFDCLSAHTNFILRPKDPSAILPGILEAIVRSDGFQDHLRKHFRGSTNLFVNWSDAAEYEFALPPLDEQQRIAGLLINFDYLRLATHDAAVAAERLCASAIGDLIDCITARVPLQSLSRPIVRGIDSPGPDVEGGVPYVRIAEMTGPEGIVVDRLLRTSKEIADAHPESRLEAGDFVVALRGVVGLPIRVPETASGAHLSRGTARLSVMSKYNADFVYYALLSARVKQEILRNCTGWKGEDLREITLGALRELKVPAPSREVQDHIAQQIGLINASIVALRTRISGIAMMRAAVLKHELGSM